MVGVVRGNSIEIAGMEGAVERGATGADVQHPPSPTAKAQIPHHRLMAIPADKLSGIVRDRAAGWAGLNGLSGSAVFSEIGER